MKAIWKGYISFGLVSIPITLHSSSESKKISFHMLHNKDKHPVKYKRWCEKDNEEVAWKDIVKGVEIAEDEYIVVEPEELRKLKPERTQSVDIKGFINSSQLDDIYLDSNYFAAPARAKDKAYFLFKEAITESAKIAIGTMVMHDKEHLCMISGYKDGMLLTTLKYGDQVRDMARLEILKEKPKISKEEMVLANELISKLTLKDFDINEYKETFSEELMELIRRKASGQKITVEKSKKPKADMTLLKALKASIK